MGKSKEWDVVKIVVTKGHRHIFCRCPFCLNLIRLVPRVSFCYKLLELCHVFLTNGRLFVVIVCVEYHWEHVGYGLTFRVTHGVDVGVDTFGEELVLQRVALAVAPDDAAYLPEAEVIEELMS